MISQPSFFLS